MVRPNRSANRYVVEEVDLDLIDYEEQQVRDVQVDDGIHELVSSIDALDLLQFPGVIRSSGGRYELAWGRRRLEAFKLKGERSMPCRIYQGDKESIKALALVENMQRREMTIEEECKGVAHLVEVRKLSIDQIVAQLSRSRSWVLMRLAVPNFPADVREALLSSSIPLGTAEEIATVTEEGQRAYILNAAIYQKLKLPEVRAMVQAARSMPEQTDAIEAGLQAAREGFISQRQYIQCAACSKPKEPSQLVFIRVCANGCKEEAVTDEIGTPRPETVGGSQPDNS